MEAIEKSRSRPLRLRARKRLADRGGEDRDHLAHFEHVEVGYSFSHPWKPRLALQYDYASGVRDPYDGEYGRFDSLFAARRFEYGPTDTYGAFSRSNLNTPGLAIAFVPTGELDLMCSYRSFWLAEARDEWVGSGLQDSTGNSGSYIGQQIEARALWRPWDTVTLDLGCAHLFKGSFLEKVPFSLKNGDTDYVYFSLEFTHHIFPR